MIASTELDRCRNWIGQASSGMWRSFLEAQEHHANEDAEAEQAARARAAKYDLALTLAVLRYCQAIAAL